MVFLQGKILTGISSSRSGIERGCLIPDMRTAAAYPGVARCLAQADKSWCFAASALLMMPIGSNPDGIGEAW